MRSCLKSAHWTNQSTWFSSPDIFYILIFFPLIETFWRAFIIDRKLARSKTDLPVFNIREKSWRIVTNSINLGSKNKGVTYDWKKIQVENKALKKVQLLLRKKKTYMNRVGICKVLNEKRIKNSTWQYLPNKKYFSPLKIRIRGKHWK